MKKVKRFIAIMVSTVMLLMLSAYFPVSAVTSADLTISQNGIEFICSLEGFHSTCYSDYSQSSIGFGTKCNGSSVQPHASGLHSITREQAMIDMKTEIEKSYIPNVRRQTSGISMNQNQFDALVSLTYNCGGGTTLIKNSPLVKYLRGELSESEARSQYSSYIVTAGGKVLQGLINRRNKEADLFFSGSVPPVELVTPTIRTDKSSYTVGDTVNISWEASPAGSNLSHYWLNIAGPNGDYPYSGTMNLNTSYSFVASQAGNYTITTYATPKGSKEGEGSLTDTKTITVNTNVWYGNLTPVDLGNTFDAVILAKEPWITIRTGEDDNVLLQSEEGITEEMWRFVKQIDGSYMIRNFKNGKLLDAFGLGTTNGTNVFTCEENGGENQKWFIYNLNGGYVLRTAYSDLVLDITGAKFENGTNIQIYEQNNSNAQTFALYYENSTYGTPRKANITATSNENNVTLAIERLIYADSCNIYRSIDNKSFVKIGETTANTYLDYNLEYNTKYFYKVEYINRYYSIESDVISVTTKEEKILADLNQDGSVTILDAVLLQKHLLNFKKLTAEQMKLADINSDGRVNILDMSLLKEKLK